jgi:3-hydroxyacyl-CoA dehydrogenase
MSEVSFSVEDGIARVTIDNPPVNALGQAVRAGLAEAAARVASDPGVRAVVLACAGRSFVAGADIRELGKPPLEPFLPDVLNAIEASRAPWVAAIQGTALGGGLELALACHGRVADPAARFGLPEVTLGILPGAGGTMRLPRIAPMAIAVEMIAGGKPIGAAAAQAAGLLDVLAEGDLTEAAEALARDLAAAGAARPTRDRPVREAEGLDWAALEKGVAARARGARAPLEALAALREGASLAPDEALRRERERFLRLAASEEAAALRHAFFAERSAGRSLREIPAEPADLSRVGVIGGGTMGAGIAVAMLLSGSSVRLIERDAAGAEMAHKRVADALAASVARKALTPAAAETALGRLETAADYAVLVDCPLVIEAVFEDMGVKREVFARLDAVMPAEAVLATNTSYLDVDALAAGTAAPSRILGLHFFSPAHVMKLLEIVRGATTGPRALATGAALARRLKKIAVVAGVCDGFIGNRIMAAYRRDCEFMLEEGALPAEIDAAMRAFGYPMGLYEVQDLSGLDIAWAQRKARAATRPADERYARIADRLCEAGRLGRKTGRGWYDYASGKAEVDPEVTAIIEAESARAGFARRAFAADEIMTRILDVMQREGQAILAEGVAESGADIDVVMLSGYGFPRHKGGPMFLLDRSVA